MNETLMMKLVTERQKQYLAEAQAEEVARERRSLPAQGALERTVKPASLYRSFKALLALT